MKSDIGKLVYIRVGLGAYIEIYEWESDANLFTHTRSLVPYYHIYIYVKCVLHVWALRAAALGVSKYIKLL